MATMMKYRTARTAKRCHDYPRCHEGIKPGERYAHWVATPNDDEVNQSPHWLVLNFCCRHMYPEPAPTEDSQR